jgi:hypothetical protein
MFPFQDAIVRQTEAEILALLEQGEVEQNSESLVIKNLIIDFKTIFTLHLSLCFWLRLRV